MDQKHFKRAPFPSKHDQTRAAFRHAASLTSVWQPECNGSRMATKGYIALFGEFLNERLNLNAEARKFGWSTRQATAACAFETVGTRAPLVAVLIHPKSLEMPWTDALDLIHAAAPKVRAVICHEIDELNSQPEMTDAGAFYTLLMPADPRELQFMFARLEDSLAASSIPSKAQDRSLGAFHMAGAA